MSNNETTKLEFLFTLSGNIICQRFFNVKGYNPNVRKSLELNDEVKKICEEIEENLKEKTFYTKIQIIFPFSTLLTMKVRTPKSTSN